METRQMKTHETWNNEYIEFCKDSESDRILSKNQQIHFGEENPNIYLDNGNKQEYL